MSINRQWILNEGRWVRSPKANLALVEQPIPEPGPGQILVRTIYLSLDPTNRIWMSDIDQYMPACANRRGHARRHDRRWWSRRRTPASHRAIS